jgi:hypothetical protein
VFVSALLVGGSTLLTGSVPDGPATATAAGGSASGALSFQPELGLPASNVAMIGAAPGEAPDEVWAVGRIGEVPAFAGGAQISGPAVPAPGLPVLLRRSAQQGWQVVPVVDARGDQLSFADSPNPDTYQPVTYDGGIALLGESATHEQTLITRDPGGPFATAPAPPSSGAEAVLGTGEQLYSSTSPFAVALDEALTGEPARTGALVVPAPGSTPGGSTLAPGVLHYDGTRWTREPLCASYSSGASCAVPEPSATLSVLALSASAPGNAWLLASIAGSEGASLELFRRIPTGTGGFVWVQPSGWSFDSGLPAGTKAVPLAQGAMLTVTGAGVWVDAAVQVKGTVVGNASRLFSVSSPNTALGTWCYPSPQTLCGAEAHSLGAVLPTIYQSVAWPGAGGEPGTRIITGSEHGVLLILRGGGDFQYTVGAGRGEQGAFPSPTEGWLSDAATVGETIAGAQVVHVTTSPEPSQLVSWPVPFRRPLLAIAPEPGTTPGEPGAQALAVGDLGQIARYVPGEGWTPEFLYNAAGAVQTPRLRGVAWPEPGRAYAVGDEGAMWLWRSDTGLWEPDPAKPVGFSGNLEVIAFDPSNPTIGYAVGKQGVLLSYNKTWELLSDREREQLEGELKVEEQHLNFTSIAFAGEAALATYRLVNAAGTAETGGMLVKAGPEARWEVDKGAQALLASLPSEAATVLSKVAGLPDGGAVAAGPGLVIECDSECGSSSSPSPWHFSSEPLPEAQNVDALAAIGEGASVRALVSIDVDGLGNPNQNGGSGGNPWLTIDNPVAPGFGQPPVQIGPDPLPVSGYLLRETPAGWQDLEHEAYPNPDDPPPNLDEPAWPDAVLALDVGPSGQEGWVVGGQTGGIVQGSTGAGGAVSAAQTAAAMRLGPGPTPPQSSGATISAPPGEATFAVGGDAQCASPCSDFANEGLGPDVWLSAALARAAQIPGLRGFLYTGTHVAQPAAGAAPLGAGEFVRELAQYRDDLSAGGALPVYPAASTTDVQPQGGGLAAFDSTLLGGVAGTAPPGTPPPPVGTGAYAFESPGSGGTVRVIVLDYSGPQLALGELSWLAAQLEDAKSAQVPAIVMGSANLTEPEADNYALDAPAVVQTLLQYGASAYLFDSPGANRSEQIGSGSDSIPAFGTGTLGYVLPPPRLEESLGSSGFLLTSVDVAQRNPSSNRAPVSATLTPNIAQLGLDASDGTLLRRSQVALFEGLARLPLAGFELAGGLQENAEVAPEPYVPIPEICKGGDCAQFIAPSYSFSSSEPDLGQFVEPEPNNSNPRAVLQGPDGKPIPDEPRNSKGELNADGRFAENAEGEPVNEKGEVVPRAQSGLFCAYNSGTTTVSITTGGLTYSEPVTVQAGSVEQPCGTVPLKNPPPATSGVSVPPTPVAPSPTPAASPTPVSFTPPPPPSPVAPPPVVKTAPPVVKHAPVPPAFFALHAPLVGVGAALLTAPPLAPRPIPPSGTSPVFQTAVAPEEEAEEEEATEGVHNMAAYRPEDPTLPPVAPLALIVVAAAAGVGVRRASRGSRTRRVHAFAHVTSSAPRRR